MRQMSCVQVFVEESVGRSKRASEELSILFSFQTAAGSLACVHSSSVPRGLPPRSSRSPNKRGRERIAGGSIDTHRHGRHSNHPSELEETLRQRLAPEGPAASANPHLLVCSGGGAGRSVVGRAGAYGTARAIGHGVRRRRIQITHTRRRSNGARPRARRWNPAAAPRHARGSGGSPRARPEVDWPVWPFCPWAPHKSHSCWRQQLRR